MADYIEQSLAPGERIVMRGRWPALYWIGVWLVLLLLGWLVVGVFMFIYMAVKMHSTRWAVTTQRLVLKRGWITRRTHELGIERVEGVSVVQDVWGRLFGFGRIAVSGTGETEFAFPTMARPIAFRRAIEAARDSAFTPHERDEDLRAEARA